MNRSGFDALQLAVFEKRPVLKEILVNQGKQDLLAYARTLSKNPREPNAHLKAELIEEIRVHTEKILGTEKASSVARQLDQHYYVSTTDHLGPISHPFFVHSDLLAASPYVRREGSLDTDHENMIVFACSNVSLGNSSLPRSVLFHTKEEAGLKLQKLNIFAAKDRSAPVFRFRPYTKEDLARALHELSVKLPNQKEALASLKEIIQSIYVSPEAIARKTYAEQITVTNYSLWKRFFTASHTTLPDLIYLELETIVANLLLKHHLHTKTRLHQFLFDPQLHDMIETLFEGIPGAFSTHEKKGTFLFWYLPEDEKVRVALKRNGSKLESEDGRYSLTLEPAEVRNLLEKRVLIPSNMLCLMTLACYYGLKCLGGFSQVNYLTSIQDAYNTMFGLSLTPTEAADSFTKTLCGDFDIGFITPSEESEGAIPATGLDFVLYNDSTSWDLFYETLTRMTLEETFGLMMPELYRILYPEAERETALSEITKEDILTLFGLRDKIRPCLTIKRNHD